MLGVHVKSWALVDKKSQSLCWIDFFQNFVVVGAVVVANCPSTLRERSGHGLSVEFIIPGLPQTRTLSNTSLPSQCASP